MRIKYYWKTDPDVLSDICARFCMDNISLTLIESKENKESIQVKSNFNLPTEIWQKLFNAADETTFDTHIIPLFKDTSSTRLRTINLRNTMVTDDDLEHLLRHKPVTLDIHNCSKLTQRTLDMINCHGQNLKVLIIGNTTSCVKSQEMFLETFLEGAKLIKFVVWKLPTSLVKRWCGNLKIDCLQHLDISNSQGILDIEFLCETQHNLTSLCLYNNTLTTDTFQVLSQLKNLKHLDISNDTELISSIYENPDKILTNLVTSLSRLVSLDISGTNLAGSEPESDGRRTSASCDILGLNSRIDHPLEFLGLYKTNACHRNRLPAKRVSGNHNLDQLEVAFEMYNERSTCLENILNDLCLLLEDFSLSGIQMEAFLNLIFSTMVGHHVADKRIQMQACDTLRCLVEKIDELKTNPIFRRKILSAVVQILESCHGHDTIVLLISDIIRQFQLPSQGMRVHEDAISVIHSLGKYHGKLISQLLNIITTSQLFVQRTVMYVLNFITLGMSSEEKEMTAQLGLISKMFRVIQDELDGRTCYLSETAWYNLWNVLDNAPNTCQMFVELGGLELFYKCYAEYSDKAELKNVLMALAVVSNITEVQTLRSGHLINSQFIGIYYDALVSHQNNLQISYAASEALVYLVSGNDKWDFESPTRKQVLDSIKTCVSRWDVTKNPVFGYSSFKSMLELLQVTLDPECSLWVTWALANVTQVDGDRQRDGNINLQLLEKEGGLELLRTKQFDDPLVKHYAQIVLKHFQVFWTCNNS